VLALLLSAAFGVLGVVNRASDDAVRAGTLAVLGLLAVSLIRLRRSEAQLAPLQNAVDEVLAIESGAPWRVLDSELTYDMERRDLVRFTKRRRLKFYRSRVVTMDDWFVGDGWSDGETCSPGSFVRNPSDPDQLLKLKIGQLEHTLIVFRNFYKRGDVEDVAIQRTMHDAFPNDSDEFVNLEVIDQTDRARLKVIWPMDAKPTKVKLQGKAVPNQTVRLTDLGREKDGRSSYTYELLQPRQGDNVYIFWDW
jgi:hypothetical protein